MNFTPRSLYPPAKTGGNRKTAGWVGATAGLNRVQKEKMSCLCCTSKTPLPGGAKVAQALSCIKPGSNAYFYRT